MTLPQTRSEVETLAWCPCKVATGFEERVVDLLRDLSIEVYWPYVYGYRRRSRKRTLDEVKQAVYAGYIFVRHDTVRNWEQVFFMPGFHYALRTEGELALVDEAERERIVAEVEKLTEGKARMPADPETLAARMLETGWIVRVTGDDRGFTGMRGRVKRLKGGRALVDGVDFTKPVWLSAMLLQIEG